MFYCYSWADGGVRVLSFDAFNPPINTRALSHKTSATPSRSQSRVSTNTGGAGLQLTEIALFKQSGGPITELCFSPDGLCLATADADRCVALYRWQHREEDSAKPLEWVFIGRNRSHTKRITSMSW